jgi:hypothetical protein
MPGHPRLCEGDRMRPYQPVDALLAPLLRLAMAPSWAIRPFGDATSPTWETRNRPRASANSTPWKLKGVWYFPSSRVSEEE